MTYIFNQLKNEGHNATKQDMASFSADHLGRLGSFKLDLDKKAKPMIFDLDF